MKVHNKVKSFWRKIPVRFFRECMAIPPSRETESLALFNLYSIYLLDNSIVKGELYYNHEEQKIVDVEIQLMQFGFEGITVRKKISDICKMTIEKIEQILDKAEAKCYVRNLKRKEPIPPRKHKYYKIEFEKVQLEEKEFVLVNDLTGIV